MTYVEYNGKRFDIKDNTLNIQDQSIAEITEIKGLNNLKDLISLSLRNNKIKKIQGLENLINLELLDLNQNQITDIEGLEKLLNLKTLTLEQNQISEIRNISHLKNLEDLYIRRNNLNRIQGLDSLTNLQRLDLGFNKIRIIEGLDNLENLYLLLLEYNKIEVIENLENLINLERLELIGNRISVINGLNNLSKLNYLDLTYNKISEIKGLEKLSNLHLLNLSYNNISEIKGLNGLKISNLDLSYNNIEEVKGLDELSDLINLRINNNPIIDREEFLLNRDISTIKDYCWEKNKLIRGIIGDGEDETTEYKETFRFDVKTQMRNKQLKKEVTIAICAFLNKFGGELFIGVNDSGEIKGIERDLRLYGKKNERVANKDKYHQDITKTIREDLGSEVINLIAVDFIPISNQEIVKVSVNHSLNPVYIKESDFYVRDGPASVKMNTKQSVNYIQSHFGYKKSLEDEELEDEISELTTKPNINLALRYIDNFNKKKITYEKQKGRIQFICGQFKILSIQSMIDEDSIDSCLKFIMFAIDVIEVFNDNIILGRIYDVFLWLSSQKLTREILKEHSYDVLSGFFNQGDRDTDLICILVNLGFFDKIILIEIDKAVQNNDLDFITSLYYTDLSRFNDISNILDHLTQTIENLDFTSNKKLIAPLENLIHKFEELE